MLQEGDLVELSGGYDEGSIWLGERKKISGKLKGFIPGQRQETAAQIELDETLTVKGITGNIIILELRYVGAKWDDHGIVHVELCDFQPEAKPWKDRKRGEWVESHASYKKL